MVMSNDQIRFIVGIVGNVISFFLFISPAPAIYRINKKRDVEEFSPDPYIACVMNCLLWIFYGLPINHPDSILVITINAVGLVLELIYLSQFIWFGNNSHRKKDLRLVSYRACCPWCNCRFRFRVFHTHDARSNFVGIFCIIFGIIMYGSPLTIMWKVIKTKSVEFMPFWLSLAAFSNGTCWTIYALLKWDWFILIANGTGGFLGLVQLILYAMYYRTTPKKGNSQAPEVQLQRV